MNVGVLGSGFIIPYFISAAKETEGMHICGIWARNIGKLEQFKEECEYITDDLEVLLHDENIDTIYVGLPNGLHYEYAKKCLLANKSVIVEKPFVVTVKQAEELFELGKERGLFVFEAIMTKYSANYIEAKNYLSELGDIKLIIANFSQYSRRYDKFKQGIILPAFDRDLAGGALMDLGVYNIHYVVGMFGKPKEVRYFPNVLNGVDTSGVLVLDYGNFKATLVNAKDCSGDSFVEIQGDKGRLRCNSTSSRCTEMQVIRNDRSITEICSGVSGEMGGMNAELEVFMAMYNANDLEKCYEYAKETLDVQFVLESAIKFANLNY